MRYLAQFCVILLITFIGEALYALIPLPVPAGIYGMVLLFAALCLKILPLSAVEEAGDFLLSIMRVMFIPAGVGLINSWGALRPMLWPAIAAVVLVTVVVMGASGVGAQKMIDISERRARKCGK